MTLKTNVPVLQRLETPIPCEIESGPGQRCPLPAFWRVNGWVVCDEDIQFMAQMNSDNEEVLRPALEAIQQNQRRKAR